MKVTPARIELTIKFTQLPVAFTEDQGGARTFEVGGEEGGPRFVVTLSKKSCKRLAKAAQEWPEWMAIITGRFGELLSPERYRVESAGLTNVIERKPKESATTDATLAPATPSSAHPDLANGAASAPQESAQPIPVSLPALAQPELVPALAAPVPVDSPPARSEVSKAPRQPSASPSSAARDRARHVRSTPIVVYRSGGPSRSI